jgi:Na+/H+-dicarboxylate symporter
MKQLHCANLVGMDLTLTQQLIVCLTAMIASLGAPGILVQEWSP